MICIGAQDTDTLASLLTMWRSEHRIVNSTLQRRLQHGLDVVTTWNKDRKMLILAQRTEGCFFSTNWHESKRQPTLTLDGQAVRHNDTPTYLGVTYDRQHTFSCHANLVDNSLRRQAGALQKLASTSWGYDRQTLSTTYIATGRSKVEYGTSYWLLWTLENLEWSQCYAGRAITGQLHTTPVEAILAEENLHSINTRAVQLSTIAIDKSLRTTVTNSRHTTANQRVRQRTQKPIRREKTDDVWQKILGDTKPTMTHTPKPPWTDTSTNTFELTERKTGYHAIAMQTLEKDWDSYDATIYTDGVETHCKANGGSGIVVTTFPTSEPTVLRQCTIPDGKRQ